MSSVPSINDDDNDNNENAEGVRASMNETL